MISRPLQVMQDDKARIRSGATAPALVLIALSAAFFRAHGFRLYQLGWRSVKHAFHGITFAHVRQSVNLKGGLA